MWNCSWTCVVTFYVQHESSIRMHGHLLDQGKSAMRHTGTHNGQTHEYVYTYRLHQLEKDWPLHGCNGWYQVPWEAPGYIDPEQTGRTVAGSCTWQRCCAWRDPAGMTPPTLRTLWRSQCGCSGLASPAECSATPQQLGRQITRFLLYQFSIWLLLPLSWWEWSTV